jgi:hypothetical protein
MCVFIGLVAVLALLSGFSQGAYAAHDKHSPNAPRLHFKRQKDTGPFGMKYLAPKKQHPVKDHYRSPITGNTLYGKPKR